MIHKSWKDLTFFEAGDQTILAEVLHPNNDSIELAYSLAHAHVKPGRASLPHVLEACSEVYFIIAGRGRIHVDDQQRAIQQGDTIYVPKGSRQHVENLGDVDLVFLCIVAPAWYAEQERLG